MHKPSIPFLGLGGVVSVEGGFDLENPHREVFRASVRRDMRVGFIEGVLRHLLNMEIRGG